MASATGEIEQRRRSKADKPLPPYAIVFAWITLHAYLLALTGFWFPHVSIAIKAATTCSFLVGLSLIVAYHLGRLKEWRALEPHLERGRRDEDEA
jgi:hypothetical protein